MENQELPEQFQQDVLDAELTPDERMVAEEDMAEAIRAQQFAHEDPQPQVEPESNGQMIDDYTIRRAKDYGFTDQQIDSFGDPSALDASLTKMDQQVIEKLNSGNYVPAQDIPLQQEADAGSQAVESEVPAGMQYDEYMDPTIQANFKAQEQQYQQLKEQHQALLQHVQGQMQVNEISQFDEKISNLGGDFHPLLGATVEERRDQTGEAYANASQLWDVYMQLRQVSPNMADDDVFRRAIAATFPDQQVQFAEQRVRHDVSDRVRDTRGRFTARPSKRGAVAQPPGEDQEAQDWIDTWTAERGISSAPAMSKDEMFNS
jgi:hypothetical protein